MGQFIVTTEDDFQAALDTNPTDWQTRLVFADWLQERNDPRADGYRALGQLRVSPCHFGSDIFDAEARTKMSAGGLYRDKWWWCASPDEKFRPHFLPDSWFPAVRVPLFTTRREAEDAAALAFGKLLPKRRAKMLAATPATKKRKKTARKKPPAKKSKGKKPGARKPTAQKPKGKKK
jgi:uncharacterized protein (TIGR02996 family)